MLSRIMWIAGSLIVLGIIAMFIWGDRIQQGSVLAGVAALIATIKSKFFRIGGIGEISEIKIDHEKKRLQWEKEKEEYEQKYDSIKERIDVLNERIGVLDGGDEAYPKRREDEILKWLRSN